MSDKPRTINRFTGQFIFLSNFYIERNGKTNEHRFQAAKAESDRERAWVEAARTPAEAKRRGRLVTLLPDWEDIRDQVMLDTLRIKFTDPVLENLLLRTGSAILVEGNYHGDRYWGVDLRTGIGENRLGLSLMQVRDELAGGGK